MLRLERESEIDRGCLCHVGPPRPGVGLLCRGKDSPRRNERGLLSDYVWDFVNRVAREVRKTHPDKKILNCAYGVYTLPPEKIERLEPNVQVCIVGGRRPVNNLPEQQAEIRKLREAWAAKTSNPIMIFENYPFTDRGRFQPPASGLKLVSQMEDMSSPIGAFLREHCRLSPSLEVPVRALYHRWVKWCESVGQPTGSLQSFGRDLRAAVPGLDDRQHRRADDSRVRSYVGIGLRPEEADIPD